MTEIIAINRATGLALTDDGGVVHLTDFVGADGEPCAEDEAVAAVGWEPGPDDAGRWWSIDLSKFEKRFNQ